MSKNLFGTDGIRGIPGQYPLDDVTLFQVARSLGEYLRRNEKNPRVLIGMDTRESGPHLAERIAAGLASTGTAPVAAGVVTTPGVAWLTRRDEFSAGVVISASHNPYHDNGVKLISSTGMKFPDAVEAEIEQGMSNKSPDPLAASVSLQPDTTLHAEYLHALSASVLPGAKLKGMKIVLDCANGAASALAPRLFRSLGCQVTTISDRPDGRNINAGCGSLHPEVMQKTVVQTGSELGIAFDGDSDRAIFSSASGRYVDGDGVLLAMGRYMKSQGTLGANTIVGTSMANLGLDRALAPLGLKLARVPVGDRYVLEEMLRIGANLGGEQSGHILFLDDATTGDGMLTALKIASLISISGPLDSLVADLKIFPQKIVNIRVHSKPPLDSLPEVSKALASAEQALNGAGRVVLRYSGTEPLARVMVEAESDGEVRRWSDLIAAALQSSIGAV